MNKKTKDNIAFTSAIILIGIRINLIGSISITELFVLTQIPHLIQWVKKCRIPHLQTIVKIFTLLIIVQIVAEFMSGNTLINGIKGIAITIMALFLFLFFLEKLTDNITLIKWIPIGLLLRLLLFGDQFDFADNDESSYFKFYLAPLICYIVCYLSLLKNKWIQKYIIQIFICSALFIIIGGARSLGFSLLFTTMTVWLYKHYKTLNFKRILPGILISIISFQLLYANVYVPKISSGEWGSEQNREQLARINNSKNVLMMLLSARADFYISYLAFMDKPLWGHGSWAIDTNLKYQKLQARLFKSDKETAYDKNNQVPNHSVPMGMGTKNGIFAFFIFLWIFIYMYRIGFKGIFSKSINNIFLIYTIVSSFQHLMFGPPAILKNSGALAFALFFALYYLNIKRKRYEIQISSCYGDLSAENQRVN